MYITCITNPSRKQRRQKHALGERRRRHYITCGMAPISTARSSRKPFIVFMIFSTVVQWGTTSRERVRSRVRSGVIWYITIHKEWWVPMCSIQIVVMLRQNGCSHLRWWIFQMKVGFCWYFSGVSIQVLDSIWCIDQWSSFVLDESFCVVFAVFGKNFKPIRHLCTMLSMCF